MQAISLFSGIGAFELAAQMVFGDRYQTFQFVEIDFNAQKVLLKHFKNIPIQSDIKTYHPPAPGFLGFPTIIVGGFPCTDTSNAGKREGLSGNESSLWWEMYRVIVECQPDFVIVENPEGIIHRGLRTILGAFTMAGYQTEIELITAAELGAPHKRSRIFIIAYRNDLCIQQRQGWCCWSDKIGNDIAFAQRAGWHIARTLPWGQETQSEILSLVNGVPNYLFGLSYNGWWKHNLPPTDAGIDKLEINPSSRRKMINLIGRSIVPLQAAIALMRLKFLVSLTT